MRSFVFLAALVGVARAYWLMGIEDFITTERLDPLVNPNAVSGHAHSVLGGSNFGLTTNTAKLRQSKCTSIPIPQDKSNYWFPHLYFQWKNGSFTSLNGGAVIYYLFADQAGTTTAFPDDFRMLSGDPTLRTYDPNSFAQQAVTFLCLDFNGVTTRHNSLPPTSCPSGIRAQINFPSCWDGKNLDSPDHKSHVAFMSEGPDKGSCKDPKYPVTLPRIFIEVYWASNDFESVRSQAMNSTQPFVYSYGDATGYGYHADFINGWDSGVLQKAVDNCHCNPYGDPTCCVQQGIFDMNQGKTCRITKTVDEQTTGTIPKLPGNNPVQPEGKTATMYKDPVTPAILAPVYVYTGDQPTATGSIVTAAKTATGGSSSSTASNPTGTSSSVDGKTSTSSDAKTTSSAISSSVESSSSATASNPTVTSSSVDSDGKTSSSSDAQPTGSSSASASTVSASSTTPYSTSNSTSSAPSSTPSSSDSDSDDDDGEDCDDSDESSSEDSDGTTSTPSNAQPTGASSPSASTAPASSTTLQSTSSAPSSTPSSSGSNSNDGDDPEDCDDSDDSGAAPSQSASSNNAPPASAGSNGYSSNASTAVGGKSGSNKSHTSGSSSNASTVTSGKSGSNKPQSSVPAQGLAAAPTKDQPSPGSCNMQSFHKQYLSHKKQHSRSLHRVRRHSPFDY